MAGRFLDHLGECNGCPHCCGVNRLQGEIGICGIDSQVSIAHIGLHFGEEPPISGTRGSGTVFFAGCNLQCVYCQNYQISQEFLSHQYPVLTVEQLVEEMLRLQEKGAHNINFVSPSHMVFQMAEAIQIAKAKGLILPIVYNSNGYDSVEVLRLISGLVDIYLPDIKYLDNPMGNLYSKVHNYADTIEGVLQEMFAQVGNLALDDEGLATSGVLVRHLVLPGHGNNSRHGLDLLRRLSKDVHISLMSQYSPCYQAGDYPAINRSVTEKEYAELIDYAWALGLENVFIQELESKDHYLPDFEKESPFE